MTQYSYCMLKKYHETCDNKDAEVDKKKVIKA